MPKDDTRASLVRDTDAEIALAIHYLDPEFNTEWKEENDRTVLGFLMRSMTSLTGANRRFDSYQPLHEDALRKRASTTLEACPSSVKTTMSIRSELNADDVATVIGVCVSCLVMLAGALVYMICGDLLMVLLDGRHCLPPS